MYTANLILSLLQVLTQTASAAPMSNRSNITLSTRDADTFNIEVHNNCAFTKQFALYQNTNNIMVQKSTPINTPSKGSANIPAPYTELGMRLSGHAEWGTDKQWNPQAMFEFGYADMSYAGLKLTGTAYDASVMKGSDTDIGIGIYPLPNGKGSKSCASKTCFPWACAADQGWMDPDQVNIGSPADTVCYKGKMDFKVVFCP